MLLLQVSLLRDDGSDGGQGFASLPHGPGVGLPAHMPPVVVGGRPSHALSTRGVELDVEVGRAFLFWLTTPAGGGQTEEQKNRWMDGWMDK